MGMGCALKTGQLKTHPTFATCVSKMPVCVVSPVPHFLSLKIEENHTIERQCNDDDDGGSIASSGSCCEFIGQII